MRKHRFTVLLLGLIASVLLALLAFSTVSTASRDRALIRQNALSQGYWIVRALEIGHGMMPGDDVNLMRQIVKEVEQKPHIQFALILDADRRVLIASDPTQEGRRWPDAFGEPVDAGRIMRTRAGAMDLVFPAFLDRTFHHLHMRHPNAPSKEEKATWALLRLDVSEELAHYRASVMQSVGVSLSVVGLGLAAFWYLGLMQRYRLASASLAQLEQIRHHLARFVPGAAQRLIEENPQQPFLDKVEREATVLFLDIDHYTTIAAEMAPGVLNRLMETYFSSFLDIILSHGGDINETAGDGIMAIFTAKTAQAHASNAVKAACAIREQATALNRTREPQHPEIVVNIGINTGQVLLGATMMSGSVGERLTYTASGMVTNIAARLCDLGAKGEIHLSDATAKVVSGHCALQGPLEVKLKNVQGVTLAYKVA